MESHIFIGGHKCGSTSLQKFFATRFQQLKKQNFLYPYSDLDSIILSRSAFKGNAKSSLQRSINKRSANKDFLEPHNGLAFRMLNQGSKVMFPPWHKNISADIESIFKLIRSQIEDSRPDKLVIVSEVMSNFAFAADNLIDDFFWNMGPLKHSVYAILRRPDDYLQSWYGQELCFPNQSLKPIHKRYLNHYKKTCHFDYKTMVKSWAESKYVSNFTVTNYSEVNEIIEWFTNNIGLELPRAFGDKPRKKSNISLHKSFFGFINHCKDKYNHNSVRRIIEKIKDISRLNILPSNSTLDILGSDLRQQLYNDFKPIHKYLSTLSSTDLFFPDYEQIISNHYIDAQSIERECLSEAIQFLKTQDDGAPIIKAMKGYSAS